MSRRTRTRSSHDRSPFHGFRRMRPAAVVYSLLAPVVLLGAVSGPAATGGLQGILGVTREDDSGGVVVALTPKKFEEGKLTVEMKVNTHTVNDLDKYSVTEITTLEYSGKQVAPTSAPKLRGHHNSGELVFPLPVLPDSLVIKIRDLAAPGVRVFSWP